MNIVNSPPNRLRTLFLGLLTILGLMGANFASAQALSVGQFTPTPAIGTPNSPISFTVMVTSVEFGPGGNSGVFRMDCDFGDGVDLISGSQGVFPAPTGNSAPLTYTHTYTASGYYTINLRVTDLANGETTLGTFGYTVSTTQIGLVSSVNPVNLGQAVMFTASVSGDVPTYAPTGSVQFLVNGVAAQTVPLDASGQADFTTSGLTNPTNVITAIYSGDSNYVSAQTNFTETVNAVLPPVINGLVVKPVSIWPPDGRMHLVRVSYSVTSGDPLVKTTLAVTNNGASKKAKSLVLDLNHVRLKAVLGKAGQTLVYIVTVTAADTYGHSTSLSIKVPVLGRQDRDADDECDDWDDRP